MKKTGKFICLILAALLALSIFAGCRKGKNALPSFDLAACIDRSSVEQAEGDVRFSCVLEDERVIRFLLKSGELTDDGITLGPGGMLVSLDAVGQIYSYEPAEVSATSEEVDFNVGIAYSEQGAENVESMEELIGSPVSSLFVNEMGEGCAFDLSEFLPNYVYIHNYGNGGGSFTFRSLTVSYDPAVKDTLSTGIEIHEGYKLSLSFFEGEGGTNREWRYEYISDSFNDMITDTSAYSCMDLLASIDRSSIVTSGEDVSFSAVTPEGQTLRFAGKNMEIGENSLVIQPGGYLCSLDSIGQIYGFDAEYPAPDEYDNCLMPGYAYTFDDSKLSVSSADDLVKWPTTSIYDSRSCGYIVGQRAFLPNFVYVSASEFMGAVEANELKIYYDPSVKTTGIKELKLDESWYGYAVEGEKYDASKEKSADMASNNMAFYLLALPDTEYSSYESTATAVYYLDGKFFSAGDLKDPSGKVLDKNTAMLTKGCTLDITVGDYTLPVEIPVVSMNHDARSNHERVPYVYPDAVGQLKTLVIPLVWQDRQDMADMQWVYSAVGRVMDESGNVTDHSSYEDDITSLSEYYDAASYGKLEICSFVTDFHVMNENFADVKDQSLNHYTVNEIMEMLYDQYPDMDWTQFDADGNGYFDSVVFLGTAADDDASYQILSHNGAFNQYETYSGDYAGDPEFPRINNFTYAGRNLLSKDFNTLHHEFAHGLGLIDYYDVTYSGINAVGNFDMQSGGYGDWNCYSKLSVGWIDPIVVEGLAAGESAEFTIGSSALEGDVIVIPATRQSYDGPFGEYIMVDLLTDDGVNRYDAEKNGAELGGVEGVRISHVNAMMETHTEVKASKIEGMDSNPVTSDVATPHYVNAYNDQGKYHIEVIQSGGANTFGRQDSERTMLTKDDLFYAGDSFSLETHGEFFADGRMDDGSDFGYVIEIVEIAEGGSSATVRVTRK